LAASKNLKIVWKYPGVVINICLGAFPIIYVIRNPINFISYWA